VEPFLISGLDDLDDAYEFVIFPITFFDFACCSIFVDSYSCFLVVFPFSIVFISICPLIKSVSFSLVFLPLPVINCSTFPLDVGVAVFIAVFILASVGLTIPYNVPCSIAFPFIVFPLSPIAVTIREFNFRDTNHFTATEFPTLFLTAFSNFDNSTF
jgi:hypothetical protein